MQNNDLHQLFFTIINKEVMRKIILEITNYNLFANYYL